MWHKASARAPKWAVVVVLVLLLATTALAAAQSPDLLLPLVTGGGQAEQVKPEIVVDGVVPPLVEEEIDPNAPVGDSRDTHSGDQALDLPAEMAAIDAFDATQWTVQNNLGIGTDAPTADLDLSRNVDTYTRIWVRNPNAGGNAQSQLALTTANSSSVALQQFGSGFSASWNGKSLKNMARLRTSPTDTGLIVTTGGAAPLILGTADQERMRITSAGRVGIGVSNPTHQLSIAGGPWWTSNQWVGSIELGNANAIGWRHNSEGYSFGMGQSTSGLHFFRTTSDPGTTATSADYALTIANGGSVGIGTTSPQAKLHVQGASGFDGVYVNQPGRYGVVVNQSGLSGVRVNQPERTGVWVDQPGESGVYVFRPRYDGVSVYHPGDYSLDVSCPCGDGDDIYPNTGVLVESGNIRVHNGSFIDTGTNLAVPDYVFEPEYPLMSLDELRTYVTAEKHLPNVPNEEEIRAGGLDLSDFQMKLLEKTEELTLYTLAQDEQIKSQQQEIESLQQMIVDLETRLAALEAQE